MTLALVIPVLSREYVRVPVSATFEGRALDPVDAMATVQFAVAALGVDPVEGDWRDGDWEVVAEGTELESYLARILIGSGGGVPVAKGLYDLWLRIANAPERPARKVGQLEVV